MENTESVENVDFTTINEEKEDTYIISKQLGFKNILGDEENEAEAYDIETNLNISNYKETLLLNIQLKEQLEIQRMLKWKNNYLQKYCIIEILKENKMDLLDCNLDEFQILNDKRYQKKQAAFAETKRITDQKREALEKELEQLKTASSEYYEISDQNFNSLVNHIIEVDKNVMLIKFGKRWSDQYLKNIFEKYKQLFKKLSNLLFTNLKLCNYLNTIQTKLCNTKKNPRCKAFDYEQSKAFNQETRERIDNQDSKIQKLREKCFNHANAIQHMEEMLNFYAKELTNAKGHFKEVTEIYEWLRYSTVQKHKKKITLQKNVMKMREKIKLLTNRELLKKIMLDTNKLMLMKQNCKFFKYKLHTQRRKSHKNM